jgi:hypothetical protein
MKMKKKKLPLFVNRQVKKDGKPRINEWKSGRKNRTNLSLVFCLTLASSIKKDKIAETGYGGGCDG